MEQDVIVSKINELLHIGTKALAKWLSKRISFVTKNWWDENVLNNLSYYQRERVKSENLSNLDDLDLAALLRIADKSWYEMRSFFYLPQTERECIREMFSVRNNWAHCSGNIPGKDMIEHDLDVIERFLTQMEVENSVLRKIESFRREVSIDYYDRKNLDIQKHIYGESNKYVEEEIISEKSLVSLTSDPTSRGIVISIDEMDGKKRYNVFINGSVRLFFESQIILVKENPQLNVVDIEELQKGLTAYQILNPAVNNLYSLNTARIDFVPYQFRPALKIIKADSPRILIADSVGVGKTIEAGLILKELQARMNIESVMIICPKPLIAERKWQLEMKRFDEEFTQLDGSDFRRCISDTHRDGVWPDRDSKTIIPYSLLNQEILYGITNTRNSRRRENAIGLLDLDPAPHFDLIIVDEAHHIRNSSTYGYAAVKYLCDHASAVVFLTATPIQTGDDDLYTLLNALRPDVVIDKETFLMMSRPNQFISKASHVIRAGKENWVKESLSLLKEAANTQWGQSVIMHDPQYQQILKTLELGNISREQRVNAISSVEGLHSFSTMLNRTRRNDIQDFCIRRSHTVESHFTQEQKLLHDELLNFEALALTALHGNQNVAFMMSTLKRQAASCIFGLAPFVGDIINRRLNQIWDEPDYDTNDIKIDDSAILFKLKELSRKLLEMSEDLPSEDPKIDSIMSAIKEKQKVENNKIIIFSSFKYTLAYIKEKLKCAGLRVGQIDGSVKDEERVKLRSRFEKQKNDENAIDVLLFTEVGCEGLDYQFCNMMINYDLPWNPMRIEQRIGRIDRRGQKSETVNIYNMITEDTVDADIYYRCLMRIGVFEDSIGECSEILGEISKEIQNIAMNPELSDRERKIKLEQMVDNEIRKVQELRKLEEEEKNLFGFDLSSQTMAREVQEAENPWLSQVSIQRMIEGYLHKRLGSGTYILGEGELKTLRLSVDARNTILEDMRGIKTSRSALWRTWELYLKGNNANHAITFDSECAEKNRNALFITNMHPLAKQAAEYLKLDMPVYVSATVSSEDYKSGEYPFLIYSWEYTGYKQQRKPIGICMDEKIKSDLMELLQNAQSTSVDFQKYDALWKKLEPIHYELWEIAKNKHIQEAEASYRYKTGSLTNSFKNRKRILERQISEAFDENIIRMRKAEFHNAERRYQEKMSELRQSVEKADIHTNLLISGILVVKGR